MVYILSDILQKVFRGFSLSISDPFTLLTLPGLIGPRHAYHKFVTPTAFLKFGKKRCKPKLFNGNCPSQQPIRNRCWYSCLYICRVVIVPNFSCKDQTQNQFTVTRTVQASVEKNLSSSSVTHYKKILYIIYFRLKWLSIFCINKWTTEIWKYEGKLFFKNQHNKNMHLNLI